MQRPPAGRPPPARWPPFRFARSSIIRPARFILLAVCIAGLPFLLSGERASSSAAPALRKLPLIAIQPLGAVDPRLVRATEAQLARMFAARIVVLPPRPLPKSAYYAPRQRYRAEKILANLEAKTPRDVDKVVGLMSRDLSATKGSVYDWGVLGLAELDRRAAVVSVNRLQRGGASRAVVARRARRVAMHELGHTFGLPHCRSEHCIMSDAAGTVRTVDRSSGEFCSRCRAMLGQVLQPPAD